MRLDIWTLSRVRSDPQHTEAEDSCPAGTPSPACRSWPPSTGREHPTAPQREKKSQISLASGSSKWHPHRRPSPPYPHPVSSGARKQGWRCFAQSRKEPFCTLTHLPSGPFTAWPPSSSTPRDMHCHLYLNVPLGSQTQWF